MWLQERLEDARCGRGDVVFITGEAGVGKSRLLAEVIARAHRAEVQVLEGRCSIYEAALPYAPFVEAFRGLLHGRTPSQIAALLGPHAPDLLKLLPELTQLLPGVRPSAPLEPAQELSRLFGSLYRVLHSIAAHAPLIVAIEDIHWADPGSLQFLHFLARGLRTDRWLVLGTVRPEEVARAETFRRLRDDLSRERLAQELTLAPLGPDEISELLDEVTSSGGRLPVALAAWVFHSSEGNPFFAEEIARALADASGGALERLDPDTLSTVAIPPTLRETVLGQVAQLGAEARGLLACAAVLGRTFDLESLQEVSGLAGTAFAHPLMHVMSLHLVRADRTPLQYSFRHHLIREVVLQHLPPDLRRTLHRHVGEFLERRVSISTPPQVLAMHFGHAGEREKVARYAVAAARDAAAVHAHEETARYFSMALDALPATPSTQRLEASEGLGDALYLVGRLGDALDAYAITRECAETLEKPRETAAAWRKIGIVQNSRALGSGIPSLERALGLLAGRDDFAEEARIRTHVAMACYSTGQFQRGVEEARAAVSAAERSGDPGVLGPACRSLGITLWMVGRQEEGHRALEQALVLARQAGDPDAEIAALNSLGVRAAEGANFAAARAALERACELITTTGRESVAVIPRVCLAEVMVMEGRLAEAESSGESLVALCRSLYANHSAFASAAHCVAGVYLLRGRLTEAETLLHESLRAAEAARNAEEIVRALGLLADLALRRDDVEGAKTCLERALRMCEVTGYVGMKKAWFIPVLIETCLRTDDHAAARHWTDLGVELARSFRFIAPAVNRLRGEIAAQDGQLDNAVVWYNQGLAVLADAPQPYQEALMRYRLGSTLLRRSRPGDRKAARAQLTCALEVLERMGAGPDAERVRAALRRIGGRTPAGNALTEREREVLALVAEGLSNAAIAARLCISERTVEVHVSHILNKLTLDSRTQAAAWAIQQDLAGRPTETVS